MNEIDVRAEGGKFELRKVGGDYVVFIGIDPKGERYVSLFDINHLRQVISNSSAHVSDLLGRAKVHVSGESKSLAFECWGIEWSLDLSEGQTHLAAMLA